MRASERGGETEGQRYEYVYRTVHKYNGLRLSAGRQADGQQIPVGCSETSTVQTPVRAFGQATRLGRNER